MITTMEMREIIFLLMIACTDRYLRFEECNGDIDGNGCDAT